MKRLMVLIGLVLMFGCSDDGSRIVFPPQVDEILQGGYGTVQECRDYHGKKDSVYVLLPFSDEDIAKHRLCFPPGGLHYCLHNCPGK